MLVKTIFLKEKFHMNLNPQNLDLLLKVVSAKLGTTPQNLKQQLESGKFDGAMNGMNPTDSAKFQEVLKNPQLMEKLMSAPQAQSLYKKLSGEK